MTNCSDCHQVKTRVRILFVCSLNKWRSPTAETIYRSDPRLEVRSVGVRTNAKRRISAADVEWADAIFVRDFTRLDTYRDEGLLKAAAILDLVYSSIDLVALLLAEYDRRRGTNTHDRYIGSLKERYLKQELQLQFLNIKSHV